MTPAPHSPPPFLTGRFADPAWAWAPYRPDAARPWDLRLAGHLFRRAAFGATWEELQQALQDGPQATLDKLLHPHPQQAVVAFNQAQDDYERAAVKAGAMHAGPAWWLRRLLETPDPLLEQMTLFWHNHFALGTESARNPALICRYLQRLRNGALGRFDVLLASVLAEPAAFTGLRARANRKARPNPVLPRTLLEQYTVGPGHFSEADVQAAARAVTGWFVSQEELRYIAREHDDGEKTLLGESGNLDIQAVTRIVAAQTATAQHLARRLYRWFVAETHSPTDALIAPLAAEFAKDYDVSRLVATLLRSNLFFSAAAYRQKVKSPVDFALSLIRPLGGPVPTLRLAEDLASLGQALYDPPTTKGWTGGGGWLTRFTVVGRARLAQALVAESGPYEGKLNPAAVTKLHGHGPGTDTFLLDLLLQNDSGTKARQSVLAESHDPRFQAGLVAALPEFQLA